MAARSIATLTLSFGLVSIPVKLYSATESASAVRFNLLARDGSRLKQQYVSESTGRVVERSEMIKGYEFEKDQFVLFEPDELKKLEEAASHVVEITAFVPLEAIDPIYYDRAYFLAPDKRGGKPYALLMAAMHESGRCALAQWSTKGRQHIVQVRPGDGGLILQQLLYAEEVRSMKDLGIESVEVAPAEVKLALQLIEQIAQDEYDPTQFKDQEKQRILEAIDSKIAGRQIVASARQEAPTGGQVIDLMDALRASLGQRKGGAKGGSPPAAATGTGKTAAKAGARGAASAAADLVVPATALKDRKSARRAPAKAAEPVAEPAPARARARR